MTIEHKIIVGLDDIAALTLECATCHSTMTVSRDDIRIHIPHNCPHCDAAWRGEVPHGSGQISPEAAVNFIEALRTLRKWLREGREPFHILLEFPAGEGKQLP